MRNIHLIPTNNPSRIHLWIDGKGTRLELCEYPDSHTRNARHLYITSNEEVKDSDNSWCICGNQVILNDKYCQASLEDCSKIILTTDIDLISDNTQAIDNDFLEWFVKNPTCEAVEFECHSTPINKKVYKLIIQKESKTMENKRIPFDWEKYQSGEYEAVCRHGSKPEMIVYNPNAKESAKIAMWVDGQLFSRHENGKTWIELEGSLDILLIPKPKKFQSWVNLYSDGVALNYYDEQTAKDESNSDYITEKRKFIKTILIEWEG